MSTSPVTMALPMSALNLVSTKANDAKAQAATSGTSGTSSSGTSGLDGTTAGTTFLNLLVKELQNQDPTAPMDSTAMVGQMISLNQLDQLISINQSLTSSTTAGTTKSHAVPAADGTTSSSDLMAARASLLNQVASPGAIEAATLAASDPATTLDFSNLNIPYGGK